MRLSLLPNVPRRRGNDRRRRRFHPAILYLEDRQLLTGYTLTTLASFNGTNGDAPYAGLVMDGQGNLYGTTDYGGASGHGAVYEVANGSNSITTLASFNGADGSYPSGGLVMDGQGNLYGTASSGGASSDGTVFELKTSNPIIAATSLTWDTTQGGVDYGCTISNADLPQPTTAALYWAPTATFDPTQDKLIPGSVFTTANAAQTDPYTGHIDAATIGTPPQGTEDLLFVIDPTNRISPATPNKVASWKSDLSGLAWLMAEGVSQKPNVGTYPNSMLVSDLDPSFQSKVESFISALQSAGASISILSTRRSKERAYLMHYAWGIAQGQISPAAVPQMYGIDIRWDYGDDAVSQQAAKQMVDFFGMTNDAALNSRHIQGLAIDMSVSWMGVLKIRNAAGRVVRIASVPKNANNAALARVAATYRVYRDFADAAPHWSSDGL
jgi:uncharacterized repeat protein (TIGR03803 family)